jgi:hypothetical protein
VRLGDERTYVSLWHDPGLDLMARSSNGRTALHHAAAAGRMRLTACILAKVPEDRRPAEAQDKDGKTPVRFAADAVQPKIMEIFEDHEGIADRSDKHGLYAHDHVRRRLNQEDGGSTVERLEKLSRHSEAIFERTAQRHLRQAVKDEDEEEIQFWLPKTDPLALTDGIEAVVHLAARLGVAGAVRAILRDAPPDAEPATVKDAEGRTAVHHALAGLHTDVLEVLAHHGRTVDSEDGDGVTAYESMQRRMAEIQEILSLGEVARLVRYMTRIHDRTVFRTSVRELPARMLQPEWSAEEFQLILDEAWPYPPDVKKIASAIWEKLPPGRVELGGAVIRSCLRLAQRYRDSGFENRELIAHYKLADKEASVPEEEEIERNIFEIFGGDLAWARRSE